jgi:hypothetical protein
VLNLKDQAGARLWYFEEEPERTVGAFL